MIDIFITGSNGFVGQNFINKYHNEFLINTYVRETNILINSSVIINFAGKAHDLKNVLNPEEYYTVNTEFTNNLFDYFLKSDAKVFITLSSVKAVADKLDSELDEQFIPNPITHYGKSKLLSEKYILSKDIPEGKRVYILRPCMIHGPGNKGNLNLLFNIVKMGIPWTLGAFDNKRSFCSVDNLCFIIREIIQNNKIPSGVYNVSDNESISTNDIIRLISEIQEKKPFIIKIPKFIINLLAKIGDKIPFPLNTERLSKLTESYVVSNDKIMSVINKPLLVSTIDGLKITFKNLKKINSK